MPYFQALSLEAGFYSTNNSSATYTPCAGTYATFKGSSIPSACIPSSVGIYSNVTGASYSATCAARTYSSAGAMTCILVPAVDLTVAIACSAAAVIVVGILITATVLFWKTKNWKKKKREADLELTSIQGRNLIDNIEIKNQLGQFTEEHGTAPRTWH